MPAFRQAFETYRRLDLADGSRMRFPSPIIRPSIRSAAAGRITASTRRSLPTYRGTTARINAPRSAHVQRPADPRFCAHCSARGPMWTLPPWR